VEEQQTVGQSIETVARAFAESALFYGHGTDNPLDEAATLVFHVMQLDHAGSADQYALLVPPGRAEDISSLLQERITTRVPLAYLLQEAWFAGLPFTVDQRVLVPRSPVAELIADRFEPWVDAAKVHSILDVGTGSGCIAIACALAFPTAKVVATDISADALQVAQQNIEGHGVVSRLELQETNLMDGLQGPFDVIISNPPYVPDGEQTELPAEYAHEPALGLFSGTDGLDSARQILQDAPRLLTESGILVLEVGAQWSALEQAFPKLGFTWLEFEYGGEGVAVLSKAELANL
jgi:ribosomal protein L3 glutamine methyltransferase